MKNFQLLLLAIFWLSSCAAKPNSNLTATQVLQKTGQKLSELNTIRYQHNREVSDAEFNYFATNSGDCYFEFSQGAGESTLARFRLRAAPVLQIYNGTEYIILNENDKTYDVEKRDSESSFTSLSLLHNSIPALRIALPAVAEDAAIPKLLRDTLIAGTPYYLVSFSMKKQRLDFPVGFSPLTADVTTCYELVIDRQTWLPHMVMERNSVTRKYYAKTVFTDIDTVPDAPAPLSWFYSSYAVYKPKSRAGTKALVAIGTKLQDWALPQCTGGEPATVSSADFTGKIVLLDFWIKNCGYCLASFPDLKALQEKYGPDKVQVLAINVYDKESEVAFFYEREKPYYKMLYKGEGLAKELGVSYYPAVILLDRSGRVKYAGSFVKEKIEQVIEANLL